MVWACRRGCAAGTSAKEPGGGIQAALDVHATDLMASCPQREPWREPKVEISGNLRYLRGKETLLLDRLEATSQTLNLEAAGQIADVRGPTAT